MKKLILAALLLLCFLFSLAQVDDATPTDRINDGVEYWELSEEEVFKFLKAKYRLEWAEKRSFDLKAELSENVILVRLFDNSSKIAGLRKAGRKSVAERLEESDKRQNLDLVDGMLDFYKLGKFYFYYPQDANAIFTKETFPCLG